MKTESAPDLIRQFFLEENPNPERVGCPSEETIRAAAEDRLPGNDQARLHFADCSECFAEYRGYRLDWERRRAARRRAIGWAVAASVLLAVSGALVLRHHLGFKQAPQQMAHTLPPPLPKSPAPNGQSSTPPSVEDTKSDQQNQKPKRGTSDTGGKPVSSALDLSPVITFGHGTQQQHQRLLRLRAAQLNLSVLLPSSSETGRYQIQVTQDAAGQKVVASSAGDAVKQGGKVQLKVQLPLSGVAPGDYFLSVVQQSNTGQNNNGQNHAGQNNTGQNNAGQNNRQQGQGVYDVQVVPR